MADTLKALFSFSFLSKAAAFSIPDILAALGISFALSLFIYFVYTKTYKGVMHSSSFGISLIAMNLVTTLVILTVSSNLIASLGMVGALSIIRFRTVVKEPLDLVYLFWSITIGIVVGVGLHCGTPLEVLLNNQWVPTRIEKATDWFLVGLSGLSLNGLRTRIAA